MVTRSAPRESSSFWRRFSERAPSKMNHVLTAAVNRTLRFYLGIIHACRSHLGGSFRIWLQGWCHPHEGPYGDSPELTAHRNTTRRTRGRGFVRHRRQAASTNYKITRSTKGERAGGMLCVICHSSNFKINAYICHGPMQGVGVKNTG